SPEVAERLRALPSVEELAASVGDVPHSAAVRAARAVIDAARARILDGGDAPGSHAALAVAMRAVLADEERPAVRGVINGSGVIVHTNLGRAPLAASVRAAVAAAAEGYSNLEYELDAGERGSRQVHVEPLLCELTGAEAALVVNNCAGAVLLAAA